jgi:isopenicillin N synthase-like dioxygenase
VESFVIGADDVDPGPGAGAGSDLFAANVWPADVPGFREAVWKLFTSLRALSVDLLDVAALALGLEADFFRTRTDHSVVTMRGNWYQRRPDDELQPGQLQLGAHTDYGICTVLAADPGPGLQVVGPDGGWHDVEPLPGAFIVNLGDAMAVWTDDAWHSTIHRVVPTAIADGSRRRSFALFQDGNLETTLETLPAFLEDGRPSKYPRTTLGDHLQEKIHSGRTGTLATTAVQTTGARLGAP